MVQKLLRENARKRARAQEPGVPGKGWTTFATHRKQNRLQVGRPECLSFQRLQSCGFLDTVFVWKRHPLI
jgi:hypothetical protein